MMINTPREDRNSPTKERNTGDHGKINTKASSSTSTSWLKLKDPRIVRVSRAFGGKDRHSKVCTIRGLRDRRVRLSVPTAIQLYDLQERLGLNQPSKVVDWLLNEAKHEIDELPPLSLPPMNIGLNHQPMLMSSSTEVGASRSNGRINWEDQGGLARPNFWSNDAFLRAKSKEATKDSVIEKGNWTKRNENNKQEGSEEGISNNLFPRATHSSSSAPGLMNNPMPYGSFFQLEHPNFPFSQVGSYGFSNQTEHLYNLNAAPSPSPLSLSSGSQILVAPQPYFPSHVSATSTEIDPRQVNHFQMLASSTQNLFPNSLSPGPYSINQSTGLLHFSLAPSLFHSLNSGSHQSNNKEQ